MPPTNPIRNLTARMGFVELDASLDIKFRRPEVPYWAVEFLGFKTSGYHGVYEV